MARTMKKTILTLDDGTVEMLEEIGDTIFEGEDARGYRSAAVRAIARYIHERLDDYEVAEALSYYGRLVRR